MGLTPDQLDIVQPTRRGEALLALLLGIGFDVAFNQEPFGLSLALFALAAAALLRTRLRRTWDDDLLLAGAVVLCSFSAIHASEWLVVLDVLMATALVVGVVAHTERRLFAVTILDLLRRAGHVLVSAVRAPAGLLLPFGRALGRIAPERLRRVIRVLAITVPVLLIFGLLLASADRVFGSLIVPDLPTIDLGGVPVHAAWIVFGALAGMTAFVAARRPVSPLPEIQPLPRPLAPLEWGAVLAGVDALFALFVAVQFAFLFGGDHRVRVTDGLTYAEYARSGFFQLLAVAVLTALLILGLWDLGNLERHRQRFKVGVSVLVALTGVVLASAAMRMFLYERAFGFTLLRVVATVALFAIGVALVGILAALWLDRRAQVVALLCCCAVGGLLALNVVNPERFVAEHNVARFEQTGKIDVEYLTILGHEAAPASVRLLEALPEAERAMLREHLCGLAEQPGGWRAANFGRDRAGRALATLNC